MVIAAFASILCIERKRKGAWFSWLYALSIRIHPLLPARWITFRFLGLDDV